MVTALDKEGEIKTAFVKCITTRTTQYLTNVKPWQTDIKGELISRPYDKERILNHAAALLLISTRTTIPVPRLIGFGSNPDGTAWIETERAQHGVWLDLVGDKCRMPLGRQHTPASDGNANGKCDECARIARANASGFIQDEVLPQLNSLRSHTTGLNGVVIPPLWVVDYDPNTHWPPKKADLGSGEEGYVFCHGNLHAHSILMHAETAACLEDCGLG